MKHKNRAKSPFQEATRKFQRQLVLDTLKETKNVDAAGRKLGVSSIRDVMHRLGIKYKVKVVRTLELSVDK